MPLRKFDHQNHYDFNYHDYDYGDDNHNHKDDYTHARAAANAAEKI